jgi:L-amino acid N-acyltransferase YncA
MSRIIRLATVEDASGILEIYQPCILQTAITFEETPLTPDQMRERVAETLPRYPWLVSVDENGEVLGYSYASRHAERASYRWSVDAAIYTHPGHHRKGIGKSLYRLLFDLLREQGYVNAYAGIALPNAASVSLHESLGFAPAGVFPRAGFKLGAWRDVGWWHLPLRPATPAPREPRPFAEILRSGDYARTLSAAL